MSITNTNVVAKVAAVVAGLGLVAMSFASFAVPARAATANDLAAQIAALQAQLAALGGSSSASVTFTRDLTIGSTGADVTALQNWLISKGFTIAAGATGYFGAQTAAALGKYQASVMISPAAGYFGPITRAKVNGTGGSTAGGNTGGNTSGDLEGGAGSVQEYKLMSSLNNEEVGEDEEDAEVAGLEIEADDSSDLRITAVRVVFNEGTTLQDGTDNAFDDFEDYASEVSVWLDGDEVGRVDADEFNDNNDWTKTISLDKSAIIKAGDTGELVVAVSGTSNLDDGQVDDTWTLDFRQIRFEDADGATISEDPTTNTRDFSFVSFASASDSELKIAEDQSDINDSRTIEVDDNDSTDGVEVLSFTLEAEGDSDLEIKKFGVGVSTTGATTAEDMISDITLVIDGEEFSGDYEYNGGDSYVFDDVDMVIGAGETVDAMIKVDLLGTNDALDNGDTITFTIGETQTDDSDLVDVEDESGENLDDNAKTGTVSGGPFSTLQAGPMVTFISASESVTTGTSANDDVGTFTIKYNVEAFGDTIYVSKGAVATTNTSADQPASITGASGNAVVYTADASGTATVAAVAGVVTYTDADGNPTDDTAGVKIEEGESADFTLTVTKTDSAASPGGLYRVFLKAIGWNTTNSASVYDLYDFDLEDYKTDYESLN